MSEHKTKVPSQFFQWFEGLKQGYEHSINRLFNRVEAVNRSHNEQIKEAYHSQLEALKKSYQDHLHAIKDSHQQQISQASDRIRQLEQDSRFYQEQIKTQHQTIDRLNDRYDAVIFALADKLNSKELDHVIKDISPTEFDEQQSALDHSDQPQDEAQQQPLEGPLAPEHRNRDNPLLQPNQQTAAKEHNAEPSAPTALQQAFEARNAGHFEQAYQLFLTAAREGEGKAMGAIGRACFVGEGTEPDKARGLAWLILAAEHQFEPAIKKVDGAKQKSPQLFAKAQQMTQQLLEQENV